jgi:hypothetical protein
MKNALAFLRALSDMKLECEDIGLVSGQLEFISINDLKPIDHA